MRIQITDKISNITGFISWRRLAEEAFRQSGEIKPDEEVTHFEISERGINFFVGKRER